jgi:hypothetical protein
MNNFQNYVLVTTLGCLLIGLIVTAVFLMKKKSSSPYPPVVDNCPDYWVNTYYDKDSTDEVGGCKSTQYGCCPDRKTAKTDSSGSNCPIPCKDTQYGCCPDKTTAKTDDLGSTCPVPKCFNARKLGTVSDTCPLYMDFSTYDTCKKQTWASGCNITWDGITNMPDACSPSV